jgi:hypothetical protein
MHTTTRIAHKLQREYDSETIVKSLKNVTLAVYYLEVKMTFYMKEVMHRVKTTVNMILVAVTVIWWVSVMNKSYYSC